MDKRTFILAHEQARQNAIRFIAAAPAGACVKVSDATRSLAQNALLHAMFGELAKQGTYLGRKLTPNQWKTLMISGHAVAVGIGADVIPGIEGEFVNVRESSAQMSVARMTSLIEYIHAWAAENGVRFSQDY
jgi:hypothetical protein